MLFLEIIKPQIKHLFYEFIDLFIWSILLFFVFFIGLYQKVYTKYLHMNVIRYYSFLLRSVQVETHAVVL